jgi:hypothetical protein
VSLLRTDIEEEPVASIFRVEKSVSELLKFFFVRGFFCPEDTRQLLQDPHGATSQKMAFFKYIDSREELVQ